MLRFNPPLSSSEALRKSLTLSGFHFFNLKVQLIMPFGSEHPVNHISEELCKLRGVSVSLSVVSVLPGLPFPSPGDLPDPGMEPRSPHCR